MSDPLELRRKGIDATEAQIKRAMQDPNAKICEWPTSGLTFIYSLKERVIVRTGALGGDVFAIDGGWYYLDHVDCISEWMDILSVMPSFRRIPKGSKEWHEIMNRRVTTD